jgi:SRSO17 transposase
MNWNARLWKNSIPELTKFMAPVLATLGRSERRRAAMHYVEGLLMPGQPKSIEPMAARLGVDAQSLQQLMTSSPWSHRLRVVPQQEPPPSRR